jgi:cathepsin C
MYFFSYLRQINLSVQHALDCSFYNQGCNGGYPFLVMKYGKENLFIPEKCSVYKGTKGKCDSTCDLEKLQYLYGMMNYGYVGGSYGQCSEKKIMEEVYKNGPIVVSFEPDYNFMMYKSGIYHTLDESNWKSQGLPKPEWLKVDHSVLLVGWGEDKELSEKYWILQNTWGPEWGEKGFFRVRRGVDEMGIESICESGIPIVVDNTKKQEIFPQNNLIFN